VKTVVEIGTGAGAVGLTIAKDARPTLLILTDITQEIIRVAQANASSPRISSRRVRFLVGEGLEPLQRQGLSGKVEAIVSNPPDLSVLEISSVAPEAKFEPPMSLSSGSDDPLKIHKEIVHYSIGYLSPTGILGFHVRPKYAKQLAEYMRERDFDVNEIEGTEPIYPVTLVGKLTLNKPG
jgi:release factor glutamine methyltransferase